MRHSELVLGISLAWIRQFWMAFVWVYVMVVLMIRFDEPCFLVRNVAK